MQALTAVVLIWFLFCSRFASSNAFKKYNHQEVQSPFVIQWKHGYW